MSKRLKTYEDLSKEKQQLEVLLQAQKELIKLDIVEVKQQLQPAIDSFAFVGKIFTRERGNLLLNGGVNYLVDMLFKKVVLSRSGWLTRLLVPFVIKNYSSHFVAENKTGLIKKLFSLFGHKHNNGQAPEDVSENM